MAHLCGVEIFSDEYWMTKALQEARAAYEDGEIPIGAVVISENRIIGKGYNQTEKLNDVTAHAEMLAITAASSYLNSKFLEECTLYVTVEPCLMCIGAIRWARIPRIVFGAAEPKSGYSVYGSNLTSKKMDIAGGVLHEDCMSLMKSFFTDKRK